MKPLRDDEGMSTRVGRNNFLGKCKVLTASEKHASYLQMNVLIF